MMLKSSMIVSLAFSMRSVYRIVSPGVATVAGSSPVVTLTAYFSKISTGVKIVVVCASS